MLLSELSAWNPAIECARDAEFTSLAFDVRNMPAGTLTYCGSASYLARVAAMESVTAILTSRSALESFASTGSLPEGKGFAVSLDPKTDFFRFHNYLAEATDFYARPDRSHRGEGVKIGALASVDARNVVIGDGVVIEDFVRIGANVVIGDRAIIRAGTVVGGDGFQFLRLPGTEGRAGELLKIAHAGGVVIGADVEIQANCMIDTHIFGGDTIIGDGVKIADGAHIAHCASIGERSLIAAGAIVLGSARVGAGVWIGPGAVVSNELDVGDNAFITLGAVVTRNVAAGEKVSGNFAIRHERFLRHLREIR
jgi:UDP-3-O-[3-hydroxymyristoyl] glucosamine N-acyltransferase